MPRNSWQFLREMKASVESYSKKPDSKMPTTRKGFIRGTIPIGVATPEGETT